MNNISSIAFDGVDDPEFIINTMGLIGYNCAEKSNDKTISNRDSLKYFKVTVKVSELIEAILALDDEYPN